MPAAPFSPVVGSELGVQPSADQPLPPPVGGAAKPYAAAAAGATSIGKPSPYPSVPGLLTSPWGTNTPRPLDGTPEPFGSVKGPELGAVKPPDYTSALTSKAFSGKLTAPIPKSPSKPSPDLLPASAYAERIEPFESLPSTQFQPAAPAPVSGAGKPFGFAGTGVAGGIPYVDPAASEAYQPRSKGLEGGSESAAPKLTDLDYLGVPEFDPNRAARKPFGNRVPERWDPADTAEPRLPITESERVLTPQLQEARLKAYLAQQAGAPQMSVAPGYDFVNKPDTSTARQAWNWANRKTEGAAASVAQSLGTSAASAVPEAATKPLTTYVDPNWNPKLPLGDWADYLSGGNLSKVVSPEIKNMANLGTEPVNVAGGALSFLKGLKAVKGAPKVPTPEVPSAAPKAPSASPTVPPAPGPAAALPRTVPPVIAPPVPPQLPLSAMRPGFFQNTAEVLSGLAPVTNAVRAPVNLMKGDVSGALKSLGYGVAGTAPPILAQTFAPGVARDERPGTAAYVESMKDPNRRYSDAYADSAAGKVDAEELLARRMTFGPMAGFNSIRNLFDGGNRPGVGGYLKNYNDNVGDLAEGLATQYPYVARKIQNKARDLTSPVDTEHTDLRRTLNEKYREIEAAYQASPGTEADAAARRKALSDLEAQTAFVDRDGNGSALARQRAMIDYAAGRVQPRDPFDEAASKRFREQLAEEADGTAYAPRKFLPGEIADNPTPTLRDTENAYTGLGLSVPGRPDIAAKKLNDQERARLDATTQPIVDKFDERLRAARFFDAPGAISGGVQSTPPDLGYAAQQAVAASQPKASPPAAAPGTNAPAPGAQPEMPQIDPKVVKSNLEPFLAQAGGSVTGGLALAEKAPPPKGFEGYWKGLDSSSKLLAIGGLSITAISLLKNMFGSKNGKDEDDESFLSKVLPFLGVGAAAWGLGGGSFTSAPKLDNYRQLGNTIAESIPFMGAKGAK